MPSLFSPCSPFSVAVRDALRRCHSFPSAAKKQQHSSSSSWKEDNQDSDVDEEQVIILTVRSRAMETKRRRKWDGLSSESLSWVFSAMPGQLHMAAPSPSLASERSPLLTSSDSSNASFHLFYGVEEKEEREEKEEGEHENVDVFFSVESKFSPSSLGSVMGLKEDDIVHHVMRRWEEFSCCEGWPFGLFNRRRVAVLLPPLPTTPSDSWVWRKRSASSNN